MAWPSLTSGIEQGRELHARGDSPIESFNVGINCGSVAGQTEVHAHVHPIPGRKADNPNPRGGVRGMIPGNADD